MILTFRHDGAFLRASVRRKGRSTRESRKKTEVQFGNRVATLSSLDGQGVGAVLITRADFRLICRIALSQSRH